MLSTLSDGTERRDPILTGNNDKAKRGVWKASRTDYKASSMSMYKLKAYRNKPEN